MRMRRLAPVIVLVVLLAVGCSSEPRGFRAADASVPAKPNFVFILTNDLSNDLLMRHRADYPNIARLANRGTTFENAFVTTSLCCPSRATTLRGQYSHNHRVFTNLPPLGGMERFNELGREKSTLATWLTRTYRVGLAGRYLNGYEKPPPPGWDKFYGGAGPGYHTDRYSEQAAEFIRKTGNEPFFLWVGTKAPHVPANPAPRHADAFPGLTAPRPPSFDEADVSDKPSWVRERASITGEQADEIDALYRKQAQSMLAVDEMVGRIVKVLREKGELSRTYIVFTSDNGWKMGEHRLVFGKWTAYEEDIHMPLIVRGPGVPEGETLPHLVLNNDLAPTFADLAGAKTPSFVDGRSLKPLLNGTPPTEEDWRRGFLVEAVSSEGAGRPAYAGVRTRDMLYVEYTTGERELYDLRADPYQLTSLHDDPAYADERAALSERLEALKGCAAEGCRTAEGP